MIIELFAVFSAIPCSSGNDRNGGEFPVSSNGKLCSFFQARRLENGEADH